MSRPLVLGILNVTPDSFSDGGLWAEADAAIEHGLSLAAQGADIIDVGGESTRPGAPRVPNETEARRVLPVIAALADRGVVVSVDTTRAQLAAEALDAGATWINDVSAGLADPAMLRVVAERGGSYIAMHWRGHAREMAERANYGDVVAEVIDELAERRDAALAAGIAPGRLVLDPGIGFAKTAEHNWEILRRWGELGRLGAPLLLAASRKRFLGALPGGAQRPPLERDAATAALTALIAAHGLWGVRVHDVPGNLEALRVAEGLLPPAGSEQQ